MSRNGRRTAGRPAAKGCAEHRWIFTSYVNDPSARLHLWFTLRDVLGLNVITHGLKARARWIDDRSLGDAYASLARSLDTGGVRIR